MARRVIRVIGDHRDSLCESPLDDGRQSVRADGGDCESVNALLNETLDFCDLLLCIRTNRSDELGVHIKVRRRFLDALLDKRRKFIRDVMI